MKHNTHIYLAAKAIEFSTESIGNMKDAKGNPIKGSAKTKERTKAKHRQRILHYYRDLTLEASWAPDDILRDNDPFHIFKLFTDDEFKDHGLTDKQVFVKDGKKYYKFGGGLPFRVDHIAQSVAHMCKLRQYNDHFSMEQIIYHFLMLSHYVADAHVPMHCDLRDDPPKKGKYTNPSKRAGDKPNGKYMKDDAHEKLETLWDDAVTPVAFREEIIPQTLAEERTNDTDYSKAVTFEINVPQDRAAIQMVEIPKYGLMDFMKDVCINSKIRCQRLFPIDNPEVRDDNILEKTTREIFSDCIGNLMSIWRYIWEQSLEDSGNS
jgi:hypothetical protein